MKLRPLVIDDRARAEAQRVLDYAGRHHYTPYRDPVPGDNPAFVAHFGTYRAVFTYTRSQGGVWRHLSISIPAPRNKYPNPAAAFTIAELFGFTGWDQRTLDRLPHGWIGNTNEQEHSIVLAQAVGSDVKAQ